MVGYHRAEHYEYTHHKQHTQEHCGCHKGKSLKHDCGCTAAVVYCCGFVGRGFEIWIKSGFLLSRAAFTVFPKRTQLPRLLRLCWEDDRNLKHRSHTNAHTEAPLPVLTHKTYHIKYKKYHDFWLFFVLLDVFFTNHQSASTLILTLTLTSTLIHASSDPSAASPRVLYNPVSYTHLTLPTICSV